jgi:hypothetical protein
MYGVPFRFWDRLGFDEKTVEVNYLSELCRRFNYKVTIIGPNSGIENEVGFDAFCAGLPPGRIFALQFKKPHPRKDGKARFIIDVDQLHTLLDNFQANMAYYVVFPYTDLAHFINAHQNNAFIRNTKLIDIYDIPLGRKKGKKTRTLKYNSISDQEITDPITYLKINKSYTLDQLIEQMNEETVGIQVNSDRTLNSESQTRGRNFGKTYFIHYNTNQEKRK